MISGTVAIGGAAGVGVGISVTVLNSNVIAEVGNGSTLTANGTDIGKGNILVEASSGAASGSIDNSKTNENIGNKVQAKVDANLEEANKNDEIDRKSVVEGKRVGESVDNGGCRYRRSM